MYLGKLRKSAIFSFIIICILGTLLHFLYDLLFNNSLIAFISAVNESVFEHIKIAVLSMILLYFFDLNKYKQDTLVSFATLVKIIFTIIFIPLVHYAYTTILGEHIAYIDISLFYITILIAQIIWYKIMKYSIQKEDIVFYNVYNNIAQALIVFILIILFVFTYFPPHFELFRDPVTNSFGVIKIK